MALAVSSEASVTIKGKPLDEIDDVVSVATDGGTAELKKYSLGVLANETDGENRKKSLYVQRISGDNTASDTYSSSYGHLENVDEHSGMHVAASSLTTEEGRAILYVEYHVSTNNGTMTVWPYATFVRKDGSISKTIKALELIVDHEKSGGAYDQDIDGGIFLPNDTNEYFAVAMLKNSHTAATGDLTCSANIFIIGMNLSCDQANIFDTGVVIEKDMKQGYSPVSVAVGDFMGSGTTDQIAFTTASAEGITMTVCQIKKDSGGDYSYETLREETVCTYTGRMKRGYIENGADYYPSA